MSGGRDDVDREQFVLRLLLMTTNFGGRLKMRKWHTSEPWRQIIESRDLVLTCRTLTCRTDPSLPYLSPPLRCLLAVAFRVGIPGQIDGSRAYCRDW